MLIEIPGNNPDQRKIKEVADILRNGGIAVIPTDTIYAFATSLMNKKKEWKSWLILRILS